MPGPASLVGPEDRARAGLDRPRGRLRGIRLRPPCPAHPRQHRGHPRPRRGQGRQGHHVDVGAARPREDRGARRAGRLHRRRRQRRRPRGALARRTPSTRCPRRRPSPTPPAAPRTSRRRARRCPRARTPKPRPRRRRAPDGDHAHAHPQRLLGRPEVVDARHLQAPRRLPRPRQGARHGAGGDHPGRQGLLAARPWRRRVPHRHEVVVHGPAGRRPPLPRRQRRRVRAGHLQGRPADDGQPARAHRGRRDQLVRHRLRARLHLPAR